MANSTRKVRRSPDWAPQLVSTEPRRQRRQAVRMPDGNVYAVPDGMTAEEFGRINGVKIAPRARNRKPPAGMPHDSELNVRFADDDRDISLDSSYDEIVAESGVSGRPSGIPALSGASVIPTVSTPSAIPTLGAASGFDHPLALTPWREVTRKHGNAFLGKLKLIKVDGVNHVKTDDLNALIASTPSRGSRKKQADDSGAAVVVSKAVKSATDARKRAFEARQKKVDAHNLRQKREYRPNS